VISGKRKLIIDIFKFYFIFLFLSFIIIFLDILDFI